MRAGSAEFDAHVLAWLAAPNVAGVVCLHSVHDSHALDVVAALNCQVTACLISTPAGMHPAYIRSDHESSRTHRHETMHDFIVLRICARTGAAGLWAAPP
jgi:hypothetical protein